MNKNILTFGAIAGLVIGFFTVVITYLGKTYPQYVENYFVGYGAQIIAFSFIFVGIRNFRDKFNQGSVTFGKAFVVGLWITLIGSTIYVLVWLVDFYVFVPDFMDRYAAHMIQDVRDSGMSQAAMAKKMSEINGIREMYKNPEYVVLSTYLEILPVGLIISALSALILRRHVDSVTPVVV